MISLTIGGSVTICMKAVNFLHTVDCKICYKVSIFINASVLNHLICTFQISHAIQCSFLVSFQQKSFHINFRVGLIILLKLINNRVLKRSPFTYVEKVFLNMYLELKTQGSLIVASLVTDLQAVS